MFKVIKNLFKFKPKITQIYPLKRLVVGETNNKNLFKKLNKFHNVI